VCDLSTSLPELLLLLLMMMMMMIMLIVFLVISLYSFSSLLVENLLHTGTQMFCQKFIFKIRHGCSYDVIKPLSK